MKDYPCIVYVHGRGNTVEEACENYLEQISGKTLIFNESDPKRRKEVIVL